MYLKLDFRFKDKRFSICATVMGTSKRYYKEVTGLVNPNFDAWNKKLQRFNEPTNDAIYNNSILDAMKERCQFLIEKFDPSTGTGLWKLYDAGNATETVNKVFTFGEFFLSDIQEMKAGKGKSPSCNYITYKTVYHKLEAEGNIINKPLADIDNTDFIAFGEYLLANYDGTTVFETSMSIFKSVHTKAHEKGKNNHVLTYKYKKYAPVHKPEKRIALTKAQWQAFLNLKPSDIPHRGKCLHELYFDYLIFLYEAKSRPVDVIKLHSNDIVTLKGKRYIHYTPEKKKNQVNADVYAPITERMQSIIDKYKGQSSQGYIFPFAINESDLYSKDFYKWNNKKNDILEQINHFLKKVAPVIGVSPNDLVVYTFRHTVLTHEIQDNKKSLALIAKEAGTSVEMLEKHYCHPLYMVA